MGLLHPSLLRSWDDLLSVSWDANPHIWIRNLAGHQSPFDLLRQIAGEASINNRQVRILEVGRLIPYKTLEVRNPDSFRSHGDFLIYDQTHGSHEPPQFQAVVVSDTDHTYELLLAASDGIVLPDHNRNLLSSILGFRGRINRPEDYSILIQKYQNLLDRGELLVATSDDWADALMSLPEDLTLFDLGFVDLTEAENRAEVLFAIQQVMAPGGVAFMPYTWWRPNSYDPSEGLSALALVEDEVETTAGPVLLAEFLSQSYPEAFEVLRYPESLTLAIKGTQQKIQPQRLEIVDAVNTNSQWLQASPVKFIYRNSSW